MKVEFKKKRRIVNRDEQSLQIAVMAWLDLALPADAIAIHVPNAGKRGVVDGMMMKRAGLKAGFPDICIFWRAKAYTIELKSESGELRESQRHMHGRLHAAAIPVETCRSVLEVQNRCYEWGLPLKSVRVAA